MMIRLKYPELKENTAKCSYDSSLRIRGPASALSVVTCGQVCGRLVSR